MDFNSKLKNAIKKNNSRVCVGLDVDVYRIPEIVKKKENPVLEFNKKIIESTADIVCAYKPNMAFYEALGPEGIDILKGTCEMIPEHIPIIIDAKRGDIGNTSRKYAEVIFEELGADATTLSPYMGYDSLSPFLEYKDKTSFILCITSNKSSGDFQKQKIGDKYLYELVAQKCSQWNKHNNIGLVVGATNSVEIKKVRDAAPELPFLIPGVGAQGGNIQESVDNALTSQGEIIINSSRSIIYASSGEDFAYKARDAANELREKINSAHGIRSSE